MGDRYNWADNYKQGAIYINPELIKQASGEGKLDLIAKEKEWAKLGKDFNIYIEIKNSNNVLMHVKEHYYIIVNKRVWCRRTKRWIHVARRLANGFHFNLSEGEVVTQPRVKHKAKRKTLAIYRIIMSYSLYGCVDGLSSTKDVHHVTERYFNTINTLRYVDEVLHRDYHTQTGKQSQRNGKIIEDYEEFMKFINEIKRIDNTSSILPM